MKFWNNLKRKLIQLFTYLILLILSGYSCYSLCGFSQIKSIDQYAYVIALGFDKGENTPLKMTFQIAVPISPSSSNSSEQETSTIHTVECSTVDSGITLINNYLGREITLTHCKVLIFSEELASQGISPYMNTLFNNVELRPTCSVFICRSDSSSFLETSETFFEGITAKGYELTTNSVRFNAYIGKSKFGTFFAALHDTFSQGYITLVSLSNETTQSQDSNIVEALNSTGANPDSNYLAGESPVNKEKLTVEHIGLAVFRHDRYVGELNAIETLCHMLVTGQLQEATVTIPNPLSEEEFVDLSIEKNSKSKKTVHIINGTPLIDINIKMKAKLLSIDSNTDYSNDETIQKIEEYASSYFEQSILEYLYKTAKIYRSDIVGFGSYASSHFFTWKDWEEYDWLSIYQDSFFRVKVNTQIQSSSFLQKI